MGRDDPATNEEPEDEPEDGSADDSAHEPDFSESVELVRRSQSGDDAAREELVARYLPRVRAMVRKRMGQDLRRSMDSSDIVQDVMLKAACNVDNIELRSHNELIAWFVRVVENQVNSARRHAGAQKRDRKREISLQALAGNPEDSQAEFQPAADGAPPAAQVEQTEEDERVRQAISELEEPQRSVVELRAGQGLSWSEIAERVALSSPDAARMLYVRAGVLIGRKLGLGRDDD